MPRVVHFEIFADDIDRVAQFYTTVFGWEFNKWDGPRDYWLITTGKDAPGIDGGLMRRPEDDSVDKASFNTIDVPSVDDYVATITDNGGNVVVPKMAVPGVGYMAYCTDPDGNAFSIMTMDESAA